MYIQTWGNLKEWDPLENLDMKERLIIKWALKI
jgi:hypothetical protein